MTSARGGSQLGESFTFFTNNTRVSWSLRCKDFRSLSLFASVYLGEHSKTTAWIFNIFLTGFWHRSQNLRRQYSSPCVNRESLKKIVDQWESLSWLEGGGVVQRNTDTSLCAYLGTNNGHKRLHLNKYMNLGATKRKKNRSSLPPRHSSSLVEIYPTLPYKGGNKNKETWLCDRSCWKQWRKTIEARILAGLLAQILFRFLARTIARSLGIFDYPFGFCAYRLARNA